MTACSMRIRRLSHLSVCIVAEIIVPFLRHHITAGSILGLLMHEIFDLEGPFILHSEKDLDELKEVK